MHLDRHVLGNVPHRNYLVVLVNSHDPVASFVVRLLIVIPDTNKHSIGNSSVLLPSFFIFLTFLALVTLI
jgi:hypothetical protein